MNAWAWNLVPAPLSVPSSRLLVSKHCSGRPTFKDHSLAILVVQQATIVTVGCCPTTNQVARGTTVKI